MHSVDTAMKSKSYLGKRFASPEQAKEATLLWIDGGYAKNFGAIKDDIQLKPANERRQDLVDEWYSKFTSSKKQGNDGDTKELPTGFKSNTLTVSN